MREITNHINLVRIPMKQIIIVPVMCEIAFLYTRNSDQDHHVNKEQGSAHSNEANEQQAMLYITCILFTAICIPDTTFVSTISESTTGFVELGSTQGIGKWFKIHFHLFPILLQCL